jgi:hypothetical protein
MKTDTLNILYSLEEFSESHKEEWRNEVARDLNRLVGRAAWRVVTDGCEIDRRFSEAVIRIVKRVSECDGIKKKAENPYEITRLRDIIKRASSTFCEEGSDGEVAAAMFKILSEV